jgi:hypothetical protein
MTTFHRPLAPQKSDSTLHFESLQDKIYEKKFITPWLRFKVEDKGYSLRNC